MGVGWGGVGGKNKGWEGGKNQRGHRCAQSRACGGEGGGLEGGKQCQRRRRRDRAGSKVGGGGGGVCGGEKARAKKNGAESGDAGGGGNETHRRLGEQNAIVSKKSGGFKMRAGRGGAGERKRKEAREKK